METVYLETTIISYLVSRPSRDKVLAAHQQVTRAWWATSRHRFICVVSDEVMREITNGDEGMARERLRVARGLPRLESTPAALDLASLFIATGALPPAMHADALHLAIAALARVDFLLTWNCKHLANAHILRRLEAEATRLDMALPTVGTPLQLTED
jgi:hypothetical protein